MNQFSFTKMHGLGNSYIYVNMFEETIPESLLSLLAVKVSNVNTGIGADGMILICPSKVAPVKMRIFNSDGSEGKNCGNGLRCVAKYVYEHGIVNDRSFFIETLSGLVKAEVEVENGAVTNVTIDMGKPRLKRSEIPMVGPEAERVVAEPFEVDGQLYEITAVSMGNPHVIFYVDDINQAAVTSLGPIVEKDKRFPEGVNVEFVEVVNDHELHFRVWERGSGVTQACGTGACAAVVASVLNGKTARNKETIVHLAGGDLTITWTDEGNVRMTGPAETICTGVYYY
ncbi:diaminopimelate epimerase [Parageobacillus thermoglucosidasius]|uniref:Diaminopimelate epimerase n=2 Tax=Anoxybacillaceae TaxID=3120669 RepID=A0AAN0YLF4_PARTM|nr:diaminopimelate epimerase [Parageobacillus thermoglucosidasius]KYD13546.1 Diaminopimelate epimerase [Anoxybacillus flavithermus]REK59050.1 MAG: diaminopimelate epimerase [Geobacillus sp.]AEH46618.1 diaminopimelate epimerase [Parageobacillus thermoglucosidasius C56-YS93]ALF08585.1 diaminopimelate epimerase [Parageobacillus thermoglucosidasius]ANZ28669.1 diaminopimelate epimerase [Parageobacillus thermoglucosidasius]